MTSRRPPALLILLLLASILLLTYVGYRSWALNMTHDESSTWINFQNLPFWESLQSREYWYYANNHLINTALFQQTTALFGVANWTIRLPNVLAYLIYIGASIYIILQLTDKVALGMAAWALFHFNPYLLDFFSLARGYGLAMGFTLLSLAFFLAFIKNEKWTWALAIFATAGLSVLSNFTQLLFLAALWLTYTIYCLGHFKRNIKTILYWQWQPLLIVVILIALITKPIIWLQKAGEFEWGTSQLKDTFWLLTTDSLYGQKYFSDHTVQVFCYSLSFISASVFISFFWTLSASKKSLSKTFFQVLTLLLFSIIFGMVLQRGIFGSEYLINRKAIVFIPIWGAWLFAFLCFRFQERPKFQLTLASLVFVMGAIHFSRSMNFKQVREWWYDKHTLEMIDYVIEKTEEGQQVINLGVHWMFYPTTLFYKQTRDLDQLKKLDYQKDIQPNKGYQYYYVFKSDYKKHLQEKYEIEKQFEFAYLLKNKQIE